MKHSNLWIPSLKDCALQSKLCLKVALPKRTLWRLMTVQPTSINLKSFKAHSQEFLSYAVATWRTWGEKKHLCVIFIRCHWKFWAVVSEILKKVYIIDFKIIFCNVLRWLNLRKFLLWHKSPFWNCNILNQLTQDSGLEQNWKLSEIKPSLVKIFQTFWVKREL